jgi:LysM repeat protein
MNNPNPFVPKGSLQEQQNKRRANLKLGVLGVLTVGVVCLTVMLIQGCKQKAAEEPPVASEDTNTIPVPDTNVPPPMDVSNTAPPLPGSNSVSMPSPVTPVAQTPPPITPVIAPQPPAAPDLSAGGEYVVVKGDTLAKIAKKNGVSLKALEAANEGVKPSKLKIGQKLVVPAGGKSLTDASTSTGSGTAADSEGQTYTVKSGDTLTKIAKAHHVKVKELEAANGLTTSKIKVGEKLKIPAKGEVATAPAAPAAPVDLTPAPAVPVVSPAPATPTAPVSTVPAQH